MSEVKRLKARQKKKVAKGKAVARKAGAKRAAKASATKPTAESLRKRFRGTSKSDLLGRFEYPDYPIITTPDPEVELDSLSIFDPGFGDGYQVAPPGVPYIVDDNGEFPPVKMWEKAPVLPPPLGWLARLRAWLGWK